MVTTSKLPPGSDLYDVNYSSIVSPLAKQGSILREESPVHRIKAEDLANLYALYATQPLSVNTLFPWLHSIDLVDYERANICKLSQPNIPSYRGLTLLHGSKDSVECRLLGSVSFEEIISSTPSPISEQFANWTFITSQNPSTNEKNMNLRNFAGQTARYASISDIVIYSVDGGDSALDIAKKVSSAQENIARVRKASTGESGLTYKTYVVTDPFSKIEALLPNLVAIRGQGYIKNHINYYLKERSECELFTKASEISPNVWVGNIKDLPYSRLSRPYSSSEVSNLPASNPNKFSISLEAREFTGYPNAKTLAAMTEKLDRSTTLRSHDFPSSMVHTSVGVGVAYPFESIDEVTEEILKIVKFIRHHADQGRKILICCKDGYTETSIVTLTYLMYRHRLTLTQAYYVLQIKRSFFVAHRNLELIMCVEDLVWTTLEAEHKYPVQFVPDVEEKFQVDLLAAKEIGSSWFYNSKFKGSFPSRILPYLYLGDYNHATNPDLLKLLGISHILSAGEDTKLSTRQFEILYLRNFQDNGIDSLLPYLEQCVQFIETARITHKQVLVHCRVGVSRSASIVIAYLMKTLKKTFSEAYLMTRARRMAVVIQPNLRFVYELLMYERQLIDQGHLCHGSGPWVMVCKNICTLNSLYNI